MACRPCRAVVRDRTLVAGAVQKSLTDRTKRLRMAVEDCDLLPVLQPALDHDPVVLLFIIPILGIPRIPPEDPGTRYH